jgi:hypothetical protein
MPRAGNRPAHHPCVLAALLMVAIYGAAKPAVALAQCTETRATRPLFLAGGGYDAPLRESANVAILIPVWDLEYGEPGCATPAYRGVLVEGGVGRGGHRLTVGLARWIKPNEGRALFGQDVLVSALRTGTSPRAADADSTYVSVEGGVTFIGVRVGLGVAQRLGTAGTRATLFRWSLGARIGW